MSLIPLICILGPTGIGKSKFALEFAKFHRGEIISADSRQIYKGLNIGTATPNDNDLEVVPHHLINSLNPDQEYGLANFLEMAEAKIHEIIDRGNLPIVVGGTSQYVFALINNWNVPKVKPDKEFRKQLEEKAKTHGPLSIYEDLVVQDPKTAEAIDYRNIRRVIRALEIQKYQPEHVSNIAEDNNIRAYSVAFTTSREELYKLIDQRVDKMISDGWVREVQKLVDNGYDATMPSMSSIGYVEIIEHLLSNSELEGVIKKIKTKTHKLARNQYVWLRKADWVSWFKSSNEGHNQADQYLNDQLKLHASKD
ncbi:MAG: tRNA dimethylallyltransferase [Chloroflexi bacterium]|jgi:tRNA dimethylallyltransferase|nr:MAG: tRNA dimethylallyltransferase [Chloroflexota bacterium]